MHQASTLYMSSNIPIDYGTGEEYTAVEVHLVEYIVDHPGKTVTELSRDFNKTKAAFSQMLKKIEKKGLIEQREALDSKKKQLYYATEKGHELNTAHLRYDEQAFNNTIEIMRDYCSEKDIEAGFRMLESYVLARRNERYRLKETK